MKFYAICIAIALAVLGAVAYISGDDDGDSPASAPVDQGIKL